MLYFRFRTHEQTLPLKEIDEQVSFEHTPGPLPPYPPPQTSVFIMQLFVFQ